MASGKITGEEDIWSHTDLWDFQANVDGARVGYEGLKPLLEVKDPELSKQIQDAFDALQAELDKYRDGEVNFVFYDKVTEAQRKELSDADERARRAAVEDDGSHHSVTPEPQNAPRTGGLQPPAAPRSRRRGRARRRGRRGRWLGLRARVGGAARTASTRRSTPSRAGTSPASSRPIQDRLHFASFDVRTDSRDELVEPAARSGRRPRAR